LKLGNTQTWIRTLSHT